MLYVKSFLEFHWDFFADGRKIYTKKCTPLKIERERKKLMVFYYALNTSK